MAPVLCANLANAIKRRPEMPFVDTAAFRKTRRETNPGQQGGRDTSSPLAAARVTADAFNATGRCNLTYWEFPALDHGMASPDGRPYLSAIAALAAEWAKRPIRAC